MDARGHARGFHEQHVFFFTHVNKFDFRTTQAHGGTRATEAVHHEGSGD